MIGMFNKEVIMRDGLPIEKGVVLTKDYLDKNASLLQEYLNHWLLYPDIYLDTIFKFDLSDLKNSLKSKMIGSQEFIDKCLAEVNKLEDI